MQSCESVCADGILLVPDSDQQNCQLVLHVCRCKFEHPWDKLPIVQFNSMGLPLRQGKAPL